MIAEGVLLPLRVVEKGSPATYHDHELWYVRAHENQSVRLTFTQRDVTQYKHVLIEKDEFIIFNNCKLRVTSGRLVYHPLRVDVLSKLLAFMDEAANMTINKSVKIFIATLPFTDEESLLNKSKSETWFITHLMMNDQSLLPMITLLRKTECYDLVRYLLSQSVSMSSLHDLSRVYGVSYSHFRRLCNQALGGKVKAELCKWRMAKAILELIEGKSDITSIIYNYGYSSSSHFSAEVKARLGKTPREICKKTMI